MKISKLTGKALFWAKPIIYSGPTLLVVAMRCFVASKMGDEVEIPDELI